MWDLRRLHAFTVVARHESVTRAAAELAVSQSPLSRQILALEDDLGFPLFERHRKRIRLNAAGRAFLREAEGLLHRAHLVREQVTAVARGEVGNISIGYVDGAVHADVLPRALRSLRREAPKATVNLRRGSSRDQWRALARGELDVGFTHAAPRAGDDAHGEVRATLLADEPFMLAIPSASRGTAKELVTTLPLIGGTPQKMEELLVGLAELDLTPDLRTTTLDPLVALTLVANEQGIAIVQQSLARRGFSGVRFRAMPRGFRPRMQIHRIVGRNACPLHKHLLTPPRPA
ncbi:MAG: LysR family transcriptional regulator [Polyangiaceae bacterium]